MSSSTTEADLEGSLDSSRGDVHVVWFARALLILFGGAALFAARALFVARKRGRTTAVESAVYTGIKMRRYLVIGLLVSNTVRCASMAVVLMLQANWSIAALNAEQSLWLRDLVEMFPTAVFLSAFSVMVLFWAQVHFTTSMVPLPMLDVVFIVANVTCYVLLIGIALTTLFFKVYEHLRPCMACVIGVLNVMVAVALLYYGVAVVTKLSETARKKLPGQRIIPRIVALSVVCPLVFVARAAFDLIVDLTLGRPSQMTGLCLCLFCEWVPSAIALTILDPLHLGVLKIPTDTLDDSTDSEAPLLQSPPSPSPNACGDQGVPWKQLYPQPSA